MGTIEQNAENMIAVLDDRVPEASDYINLAKSSQLSILTQEQIKHIYGNKGGLRLCAHLEGKKGGEYSKLALDVANQYRSLKINSVVRYLKKEDSKSLDEQISKFADENKNILKELITEIKSEKNQQLYESTQKLNKKLIHLRRVRRQGGDYFGIESIIIMQKDKKLNKILNSDEYVNFKKKINDFLKKFNLQNFNIFFVNYDRYLHFINFCSNRAYRYLRNNYNRKIKKLTQKNYKRDKYLQYCKLIFAILIVCCGNHTSQKNYAFKCYDKLFRFYQSLK